MRYQPASDRVSSILWLQRLGLRLGLGSRCAYIRHGVRVMIYHHNTTPLRGTDELKRQLRDTESELKAQERRFEGTVSAHRRELGAALAEADDARGLANELRDSLQVRNDWKEARLNAIGYGVGYWWCSIVYVGFCRRGRGAIRLLGDGIRSRKEDLCYLCAMFWHARRLFC